MLKKVDIIARRVYVFIWFYIIFIRFRMNSYKALRIKRQPDHLLRVLGLELDDCCACLPCRSFTTGAGSLP